MSKRNSLKIMHARAQEACTALKGDDGNLTAQQLEAIQADAACFQATLDGRWRKLALQAQSAMASMAIPVGSLILVALAQLCIVYFQQDKGYPAAVLLAVAGLVGLYFCCERDSYRLALEWELKSVREMLESLAGSQGSCKQACDLVDTVPRAAELRRRVVERGEELRQFHLMRMQAYAAEQRAQEAASSHGEFCRRLHLGEPDVPVPGAGLA